MVSSLAQTFAGKTGTCICGHTHVRVKPDGRPAEELASGPIVFCYCLNCRKASGSVGQVGVIFPKSAVEIQEESRLKVYEEKNTVSGTPHRRHFCSGCGSSVFAEGDAKPDEYFVSLAIFDDLSDPSKPDVKGPQNIPKPTSEIFTGYKPEWLLPIHGASQHVQG